MVETLAKQGYAQEAIARQLGVSTMTISRDLETFNTVLNVETLSIVDNAEERRDTRIGRDVETLSTMDNVEERRDSIGRLDLRRRSFNRKGVCRRHAFPPRICGGINHDARLCPRPAAAHPAQSRRRAASEQSIILDCSHHQPRRPNHGLPSGVQVSPRQA